ncbi:hypothetical protein AVEN_89903-1 [Araneus ventricosus]|uniref:Uncharacterized protein n=1 Tax=Araneus ventricosus TaxID=182803 RepID=A0A4Y2N0A5_ARAVE|nr:hypothetical protein AVEN_89903-1 [Araneus ventricosus]
MCGRWISSLGQNTSPTQKLPRLAGTVVNDLSKERVETNEGGSLFGQIAPPQGKPDALLTTDARDQEIVKFQILKEIQRQISKAVCTETFNIQSENISILKNNRNQDFGIF